MVDRGTTTCRRSRPVLRAWSGMVGFHAPEGGVAPINPAKIAAQLSNPGFLSWDAGRGILVGLEARRRQSCSGTRRPGRPKGLSPMRQGWIDRSAFSIPNDLFDRRSAWCWLVEHAAWQDTSINVQGVHVPVKRGQFCTIIRELAKAWNWSRAGVQQYLTRLAADTLAATATDTGRTLITICNIAHFEGLNAAPDTAPDYDPIHTRDTKGRREAFKKGKK